MLGLVECGEKFVGRQEIIETLGTSPQAADHVIRSLRRKGWLERASWGHYLLIPPDRGPDALGESNILALASKICTPYYFGYSTAAAHYGLTTQHRHVVRLVTPVRVRNRRVLDAEVRIVNPVQRKFFGFAPIDAFGHPVMMSDREKTVVDCIDRPRLAGGEGEAAVILATACHDLDWRMVESYLRQIGSKTLIRRVGWLANYVGMQMPQDVNRRLRELASGGGKSFYGPKAPGQGAIGYQGSWRLFVNVGEEELRASDGLGYQRSVEWKRTC